MKPLLGWIFATGLTAAASPERWLELARANYVLLDKVSDHGQIPIPQREQFFAQLFTRANLQRNRFPFLDQVSKLLESEAYRAVKPKNLTADPAAR